MARSLARALCGATLARILWRAAAPLDRSSPRWVRRNFRGAPVTLLEGPVAAAAATAAAVIGAPTPRLRAAALAAGLAGGCFGAYDDLADLRDLSGRSPVRGLRGHLRELRDGAATSGLVKLVGLSAGGLIAGACLHRTVADATLTAALVAGTANLVNLLDLRPGRAVKMTLVAGCALLPYDRGTLAGPLGAAAALAPADLAERSMLGDTGANALGALLGVALADALEHGRGGRARRLAALAVVSVLNLAGEVVSFTAVIERTPLLRAVDRLGRPRPDTVRR